MKPYYLLAVAVMGGSLAAQAQQNQSKAKPEDTEVWQPVPKSVTTSQQCLPPSDAVVLFDGKNLDQWASTKDPSQPAGWTVENGVFTVKKGTGNIQTKQSFTDYQLHIEWRIPGHISGSGQGRGNSGLFLAAIGGGDEGYELQILDNYNNPTYVNGQSGSIYKQQAPLVNANRPPGEWNVYDVVWTAPRFNTDGTLKSAARVTVFFNGVLVQNNYELKGPTQYIGQAAYRKAHGAAPIRLQDHGDPSEPISFRNIWIRPL
ncbi:MAG TPA: DUF1080 domain-containing protein [Chitinophagaceae bacterium]|jgi:hypothetical protein|nr:DUF1080 domain-containing protein [Chitinophagaceae bacterium]